MSNTQPDREPTEQEWAVVGRYLASRMQAKAELRSGDNEYTFQRNGRARLVGPNIVSAVMRAIVLEDEASKEKGGDA